MRLRDRLRHDRLSRDSATAGDAVDGERHMATGCGVMWSLLLALDETFFDEEPHDRQISRLLSRVNLSRKPILTVLTAEYEPSVGIGTIETLRHVSHQNLA